MATVTGTPWPAKRPASFHGVEVAPDHPCVQHHGAAHFLYLYVPVIYVRSDQWGLYMVAEWLP